MTKKKTRILFVCLVIGVILCAAAVLFAKSAGEKHPDELQQADTNSASEPNAWEEYLAMSPEQQEAFFEEFASKEDFEAWIEAAKPEENALPNMSWDKPGKQPDKYTWQEYQALSIEEQEAFFQWFASEKDFEAWLEKAKPEEGTPTLQDWNKPGKRPDQYTWEEYQELKPEEQEAFFQWFASEIEFEAWMEAVKPEESTTPEASWNKPGKQPDQYTWQEYQALSIEEQEAFFQWFASVEAFEAWMEKVKPEESTTPEACWNKPGKQPDQYTWKEYQALSIEEQEAFFQWFASEEAFEAWMEKVKPEESTTPAVSWNKPGKQPDQYTWEEYQALSGKEQDAFFQWFASVKDFEAWMEKAKPQESAPTIESWNKPGKQPDQYTWEEYQALSGEEQEAFFQWFASMEDFEAWMNQATEE